MTSNRKHKVCDDSSSDADELDYVISESRRALQFTRDEINSQSARHVDTASLVSSSSCCCCSCCCWTIFDADFAHCDRHTVD